MGRGSGSTTRLSLLQRLQQEPEDSAAWTEFVDRYAPRIYAWCRRWRLQDADARDVTQDVLLKLAGKMRTFSYDPGGSFRAWLKTLTHHAWSDFVASRQRPGQASSSPEMAELLAQMQSADDLVDHLRNEFDQELAERARVRVQQRVDPRTWEAFELTTQENLAGAEVAARLNMSVAAVFKAKARVLKMMQEEVRLLEGVSTP